MTQGLQFSLLFSALDSQAPADSAVFVPEQQDASYGEQASAFRQVLESEQQSKASNKGQTVAASQVTQQKEGKEKPAENVILPNKATSEPSATVSDTEVAVDAAAELPELPEVTENLADQWLGLIRQSSDASTLLRQQTALAAQSGLVTESANPDEGKIDFESLPVLNTEIALGGTDLESQKSMLAASIKQVLEKEPQQVSLSKAELVDAKSPMIDISDAAKGRGDITKNAALGPETLTNHAGKVSNDAAMSVAQAKASLPNEQTLELSLDPTAMDELIEITASTSPQKQSALLASSPEEALKVKSAQSKLVSDTDSAKPSPVSDEGALDAAALSEANKLSSLELGVDSDSTAQQSRVAPGNIEENASAKKLADNTAMAVSKTRLNDSNSSDASGLLQETVQSESELLTAAASASRQDTPLKEVPAASQAIASSASKQQSEMTVERELSVGQPVRQNTNNELAANQAEPSAISGINYSANNNSTTKSASTVSEYSTNDSGKLSMIKVSTDASENEPQSEQNQQRQDGRQYNFNRLEVTLQPSGPQNTVLPQTAALDNVVETNNTLLRAEQFSSLLEPQSRPQSATTTAPSLAAQLKQLNLQQQDAAGQLRERVQLMVRQNVQFAEIRLDPAELGQMQIRINLQQEQATVQFIVQQQHAKELLEQQMPRLRELLQQQGMQLGEGQVQQQAREDRQTAGQQSGQARQSLGQAAEQDDTTQTLSMQVRRSERLVDYYA